MPQLIPDEDSHSTSHNRQQIASSLTEISATVAKGLTRAGLDIPIFLSVPSSGNALLSLVTPVDPPDDDWQRASKIVRDVIEEQTGTVGLQLRAIPCVAVGATISPERPA